MTRTWPISAPRRSLLPTRTCKQLLNIFLTLLVAASACTTGSDPVILSITSQQKEAELDRLAAEAPDAQAEAFQDGTIDDAEYSAAILASFQCFEERAAAGLPGAVDLTLSPPERTGRDLRWSYRLGGSDELALEEAESNVSAIEDECRSSYGSHIVEAFQVSLIPTGDERRALLTQLTDCAIDQGIDVPSGFSLTRLDEIDPDDRDAFSTCAAEYPTLFYSIR